MCLPNEFNQFCIFLFKVSRHRETHTTIDFGNIAEDEQLGLCYFSAPSNCGLGEITSRLAVGKLYYSNSFRPEMLRIENLTTKFQGYKKVYINDKRIHICP